MADADNPLVASLQVTSASGERPVEEVLARAGRPDFERWLELVQASGRCVRPVRLAGSSTMVDAFTGEMRNTYSSAREPDRVLLKAGESRRRTRCPACAEVPASCSLTHGSEDPMLGSPLCPDCYDYAGSVVFNARVTELWTRTTINLGRALAARCGRTTREFSRRYRVSYAKVVEFQRRGVVHVHATIRLDRRDGAPPDVDPGMVAEAVPSQRTPPEPPTLSDRLSRSGGALSSTSPSWAAPSGAWWRTTWPSTPPSPSTTTASSTTSSAVVT